VRKTIVLSTALLAVADQPAQQLTLAELVDAYSAVNPDGICCRLKKWTEAFGDESAWAVSSERLETAAQAMIDHGYSNASANRDLSGLGSVYRWAKSKRLSPRGFKSPTLSVRRFTESIRRIHVEQSDMDALQARALAFGNRHFGVFVKLLIETGARKSELLERRWGDLDLDRREILAPDTKNGSPRMLFFSEDTAALIRRICPTRIADRLIFEGRVPGLPISFRKAWATTVKEIGLPALHMHDIRHAAAASLLRAGVTLGVAAQVLGHDPAVLARRYGHLETKSLKKAQDAAWQRAT